MVEKLRRSEREKRAKTDLIILRRRRMGWDGGDGAQAADSSTCPLHATEY